MTTRKLDSPSTDRDVQAVLQEVRGSMRQRNLVRSASIGFAAGCLVAAIMACVAITITPIAWYWLPVAAAAVVLIGGLIGACLPVSRAAAAGVIDSYYMIKDRTITAMQFESDSDPIRQLQVADARSHLRQVRCEDCVPVGSQRVALWSGGILAVVAMGLVLVPEGPRDEVIEVRAVALAGQQASLLRELMLPEIEALNEQEALPELETLSQTLDDLIEQMEADAIDEHDLMAKLSQMEQVIAEARAALAIESTEADLKRLGEAFQSSAALKQAAAAMTRGDNDASAELLEAIDPKDLTDKERRAVADDLKKFLSQNSPGRRGQLSDAVQEICEGLEKQNDSQCKDGLCKLAGLCKSQSNRKKIGECMACQLNRLAECKGECRGAGKDGGDGKSKSNSPSQKWGTGATGQPNDGNKTELDSQRREEQLQGVQGDGPSESELIESPEGEQSASRAYAQRYQKFRSQAEAVLDSEPLPLGHRETVRRYFESIRPDNVDQ